MEGTIMAAVGGTLFGSLLCHQRFKRRGQELTHTRAKTDACGAEFGLLRRSGAVIWLMTERGEEHDE